MNKLRERTSQRLRLESAPLLPQPGSMAFVHHVREETNLLGVHQHLGTDDAVYVVDSSSLKRQSSATVSVLCSPS